MQVCLVFEQEKVSVVVGVVGDGPQQILPVHETSQSYHIHVGFGVGPPATVQHVGQGTSLVDGI